MINVRKGTAHSLSQSDFIGVAQNDTNIVSGQLVILDNSGNIDLAGGTPSGNTYAGINTARYGFALNDQTDGDVIESGKIGAYGLDGNSIIETDQTTASINSTNYPIGTAVVPDATATGLVAPLASGNSTARIIGYVTDNTRVLLQTAVLSIKLAA